MWSDPVFVIVAVTGALSVLFGVQAVVDLTSNGAAKRRVNARLTLEETTGSAGEALKRIRKRRALSVDGEFSRAAAAASQLIARSGLPFDAPLWAGGAAMLGILGGLGAYLASGSILAAAAAVPIFGLAVPALIVRTAARRRAEAVGKQLPDALDIVVRSLQAGHPVPTALQLVGRELPDPIGSEFGVASSEIAYGAKLDEAVARLAARVGQPDVDLFAATVRLQARTGGNLAELLASNAHAVRGRQKMRLKIRAASSEGRASAMILSAAPVIVFIMLQAINPNFYGDKWDEPAVRWGLGLMVLWLGLGNLVMNRMIAMKV